MLGTWHPPTLFRGFLLSSSDFYCEEVLSGRTRVVVVSDTANAIAFNHTKPSYPVHIVVVPKKHIPSLTTADDEDWPAIVETLEVVRDVARDIEAEHGKCSIITNLGQYQESKHFHWHIVVRE